VILGSTPERRTGANPVGNTKSFQRKMAMVRKEKRDMLTRAVKDYIYYENESKLWQREPSSSYIYAKGKLIGMCMALGLEMTETSDKITLYYPSGKRYINIDKGHAYDKEQNV